NKILDSYDFVMLTEYFDECLVLLYLRFSFNFKSLPYVQANQTPQSSPKNQKNQTLLKEFGEKNGLGDDLILYKIAKMRLFTMIEEYGGYNGQFGMILHVLKQANQLIQEKCPDKKGECLYQESPYLFKHLSCFHECFENYTSSFIENYSSVLYI